MSRTRLPPLGSGARHPNTASLRTALRLHFRPMAYLRSPRTRRLVALLLTWCFTFAAFEAPIADVHDGGATHAELDQVTGESHADHAGVLGAPSSDEPVPGSSDHPVHVCHCTHPHTGVLTAPHVELQIFEHLIHEAIASDATPPTVVLDLPIDPPIA